MGSSNSSINQSSERPIEDPNDRYHTFCLQIQGLTVQHPDYTTLPSKFQERFSSIIWNQLLWTINESTVIYKSDGSYVACKAAYNSLVAVKRSIVILCGLPCLASVLSILSVSFLFLMSILLAALHTRQSFYLWPATYAMLSDPIKWIMLCCYLVTVLAAILLYFTRKSMRSLQKVYAQCMRKYIAANLQILNELYRRTAHFEMKCMRVNNKTFDCRCGANEIELIVLIKITILSLDGSVDVMDELAVMGAFKGMTAAHSDSEDFDEQLVCHRHNRGLKHNGHGHEYQRVNTEGEGELNRIASDNDIQTDISITVTLDERLVQKMAE